MEQPEHEKFWEKNRIPFLMLARGRKKQTPEAGSDAPADNGPQA